MYAAYMWEYWFLRYYVVYIRPRQEYFTGSGGGDGSILSLTLPSGCGLHTCVLQTQNRLIEDANMANTRQSAKDT